MTKSLAWKLLFVPSAVLVSFYLAINPSVSEEKVSMLQIATIIVITNWFRIRGASWDLIIKMPLILLRQIDCIGGLGL